MLHCGMTIFDGYRNLARANRGKSVLDRLMEKVSPEPNTGCWLWVGCADKDGYGFIRVDGKNIKTHRASIELHSGVKLVPGQLVCHRCDTPSCVNPDHLYVGNNARNQQDAAVRRRGARIKLSVDDVLAIRRRRANGERPVDLAREYGVNETSITNIANRKKWAHI
jgi:hypothetical protein